jgi:hypothetical protein|tara:strand:- start:232 stop:366 length:135 start_codon:yes stop_codon:yes gene_type:complete
MIKEAILKAFAHTSLIVFAGLITLLPLYMSLKLEVNRSYITNQK